MYGGVRKSKVIMVLWCSLQMEFNFLWKEVFSIFLKSVLVHALCFYLIVTFKSAGFECEELLYPIIKKSIFKNLTDRLFLEKLSCGLLFSCPQFPSQEVEGGLQWSGDEWSQCETDFESHYTRIFVVLWHPDSLWSCKNRSSKRGHELWYRWRGKKDKNGRKSCCFRHGCKFL